MIVPLERQSITNREKRKWGPILPAGKNPSFPGFDKELANMKKIVQRPIVLSLVGGFFLFTFLLGTGLSEKIVHRNNFSRNMLNTEVPESLNRFADVEKASIDIENLLGDLGAPHYEEVKFRTVSFHEGDTLSQLAYQNGLQLGSLLSVNKITDIRKVKAGTELVIPSVDGILYKVQREDSLVSIKDRFGLEGTSVLQFQRLYPTLPPVGQTVFVPSAELSRDDLLSRTEQAFLFPLGGTVITEFGVVTDAVTGLQTEYQGIDIAGNAGDAVYAAKAGRVVSCQLHPSLGNCVIIVHGNQILTLYGQLTDVEVVEGQLVEQGDLIGHIGTVVYGKVHHLFFSVKKNEKVVDPLTVLY